jgi:hypothetical protein
VRRRLAWRCFLLDEERRAVCACSEHRRLKITSTDDE